MTTLSWGRIQAIMLHAWYHSTHTRETWVDLVWYPTIQFVVFGLLSRLLVQGSEGAGNLILVGFLVWELVRIGQYCITISVMWEVWSKSLSNLFLSPLTMSELMIGYALAGAVKTFGVVLLLSLLSQWWFGASLAMFGPAALLALPMLFMFSVACGIFITGLILRFGTDIQSLAWGLIYLFQPFSALYYPVEALPSSMRWLSNLSPITYFMTYLRTPEQTELLVWGSALTTLYFLVACLWLKTMTKRSKQTGEFARLGY